VNASLAIGGNGNSAEIPATFSITFRTRRLLFTKLAIFAGRPTESAPMRCGSPNTWSTTGTPSRRERWAFSRAIKRGKSKSSWAPSSGVYGHLM
jgi:hypothetical protein